MAPSTHRLSLKTKLAFFSALLVVLVAGSVSTLLRLSQRAALEDQQAQTREDMVRALRTVVKDSIIIDDETLAVNYLNLLKKDESVAFAMVLSPEGKIQVHTDPMQIGVIPSDPEKQKALGYKSLQQPLEQAVDREDSSILDLALPVFIGTDMNQANSVVRIGFDKSELDRQLADSLKAVDRRIFGAFFTALVLGLAGAYFLSIFITRPLEQLRRGAQKIGEGELTHRIQVHSNDEIRDLADEFNVMGEKLKELDTMKQDFVSNVTHELRSPLTSLRGYIDLLLRGVGGPVTDLQKDYLSVVKNSSVRLGRFIDNLLDVAKIEAHKLKLTPEDQNLYELAHEMAVLFKPQLDEKNLTIVNAVPPQGMEAFVDKDKLAEVLINLTSNAIKFTPERGSVTFKAADRGNRVEFSVEDTGVGIPKDMLDKVFSKFEQVKRTEGMARNQKGTGLGLTIVKGIIEAHGGKIWVESPASNGKGTAFRFTVPKLTDELRKKLENTNA